MSNLQPRTIIIIGFFLVLTGFVLPLLMVIHVLESTFFLNFLAFSASLIGLFLGIIGAADYIRERRR
jgi:hypothetical protein